MKSNFIIPPAQKPVWLVKNFSTNHFYSRGNIRNRWWLFGSNNTKGKLFCQNHGDVFIHIRVPEHFSGSSILREDFFLEFLHFSAVCVWPQWVQVGGGGENLGWLTRLVVALWRSERFARWLEVDLPLPPHGGSVWSLCPKKLSLRSQKRPKRPKKLTLKLRKGPLVLVWKQSSQFKSKTRRQKCNLWNCRLVDWNFNVAWVSFHFCLGGNFKNGWPWGGYNEKMTVFWFTSIWRPSCLIKSWLCIDRCLFQSPSCGNSPPIRLSNPSHRMQGARSQSRLKKYQISCSEAK